MANVIEILIKAKDQASKEIDQVDKSTQKLSKSSAALQAAFKVAQTAAIGAGVAFLSQVPALTQQGIAIGKAEKALEGYTGSAQEAERWTKAVERAGDGALSTFDAIQNATRFASMGLANTAEEAAELTEIAVTLGAAMGKDATTALEDFSLMLANQSIPRLDTFGISGAAVRDRMAELAAETGETDRQLLFLNATTEIGAQKLQQLADAGFTATDSTQKLATMWQNAKDSAAKFFANGLVPIADGIVGVTEAMKDQEDAIYTNAASYEEYREELNRLIARFPFLQGALENLTQEEFEQSKRADKLAQDNEFLDLTYQHLAQNVPGAVGAVESMTTALANQTRAVQDINAYMQEYSTRLLFNQVAANLDEKAQFALALQLGLVDGQTAVAIEAIQGLTEKYDTNRDGAIDASEAAAGYTAEVIRLSNAISGLQDKTVTVKVNVIAPGIAGAEGVVNLDGGRVAGYKAGGGPVLGGQPYIVGERGPELFVPNQSGQIIPNQNTTNNYRMNISFQQAPHNARQFLADLEQLTSAGQRSGLWSMGT